MKTIQYANNVVNGNIIANKYIKILCRRFLDDLKAQDKKDFPYFFDEKTMDVIAVVIKEMRHVKGDKAGEPIVLEPWQEFILSNLYCWKRKTDKKRRYQFLFLFTGKGNGKTIIDSAICVLDVLFTRGGESLIVAARKEQSLIAFDNIKYFIKNSEVLAAYLDFTHSAVFNKQLAANIKAHSGRPDGLNGKNLSLCVIDEIAEIKSYELFHNALSSSSKRSNTLVVMTTTAQSGTTSVGYEEWRKAKKILEGVVKDETYLPVLYQLDEEDDWQNPEFWVKANPNLDISIMSTELRRKLENARSGITADEIQLRTHHLNQWVFDSVDTWINSDRWKPAIDNYEKYKEHITQKVLSKSLCCGAIDLSVRNDLSVYTLAFFVEELNKYFLQHRIYVAAEEVAGKMKSDAYLFYRWIKEGHVVAIPGPVINNHVIAGDILSDCDKYKITEVAYDRYRMDDDTLDSLSEKVDMLMMKQDTPTMSQPTSNFHDLVMTGSIIDPSEVMPWCISNAEIVRNNYGIMVRKEYESSSRRVDPVITSIMAIARLKYYMKNRSVSYAGIGSIKY